MKKGNLELKFNKKEKSDLKSRIFYISLLPSINFWGYSKLIFLVYDKSGKFLCKSVVNIEKYFKLQDKLLKEEDITKNELEACVEMIFKNK
ncbi:MAG: hypothetical protein ISS16_07095 [Ignavibacteria bacterium]|nr:hypothetical protein [Ignavibacteria bacterium]